MYSKKRLTKIEVLRAFELRSEALILEKQSSETYSMNR